MKIDFDEFGRWNEGMRSVALYGDVDGRDFGIAFSGIGLSELFGVPNEPYLVKNAFNRNLAFMYEIARDIIEAGRLGADRTAYLKKEDLRPYFERRAATAPA